jgi:primary-amine oxidase
MQASTAWLDRHFGMGQTVRDMIPYYDCPQEAIYLPASTFSVFGNIPIQRAICIFEQDTGKPLSRHFGYMEGEFGATKSYVLTIRSTTTVGK